MFDLAEFKRRRRGLCRLALATTVALCTAQASAATLKTFKSALADGHADITYQQGQQLLENHAGEPQFDKTFAEAALQVGQAAQALLAVHK